MHTDCQHSKPTTVTSEIQRLGDAHRSSANKETVAMLQVAFGPHCSAAQPILVCQLCTAFTRQHPLASHIWGLTSVFLTAALNDLNNSDSASPELLQSLSVDSPAES